MNHYSSQQVFINNILNRLKVYNTLFSCEGDKKEHNSMRDTFMFDIPNGIQKRVSLLKLLNYKDSAYLLSGTSSYALPVKIINDLISQIHDDLREDFVCQSYKNLINFILCVEKERFSTKQKIFMISQINQSLEKADTLYHKEYRTTLFQMPEVKNKTSELSHLWASFINEQQHGYLFLDRDKLSHQDINDGHQFCCLLNDIDNSFVYTYTKKINESFHSLICCLNNNDETDGVRFKNLLYGNLLKIVFLFDFINNQNCSDFANQIKILENHKNLPKKNLATIQVFKKMKEYKYILSKALKETLEKKLIDNYQQLERNKNRNSVF